MKSVFSAIMILGLATAFADIPKGIRIGTEDVPSSEVKPWKPDDVFAYSGSYAGDIAGDTEAKLKITIRKRAVEYAPYWADGTYRQAIAGEKPGILDFTNAFLSNENTPRVFLGSFEVFFVTCSGTNGVVIGGAFIPKR